MRILHVLDHSLCGFVVGMIILVERIDNLNFPAHDRLDVFVQYQPGIVKRLHVKRIAYGNGHSPVVGI